MRSGWIILVSTLFLQACAGGLPLPFASRTPTPASGVLDFQVTVVYASPTLTASPAHTPTGTPTLSPTDTPLPSLTATASPTPSSTPAAATQTPESRATSVAVATSPQPPLPPGGGITLVELPEYISLPADVGRVEFKWVWAGQGCAAPPEGQAFEIRIWPDRPGAVPLGVMDASQPAAIVCDPKSGTRSYEVGNLRGTPGVSSVAGGRFRWQVALVELASQELVAVSESRAFDLPLSITTPAPTPTPAPPHVTLPAGQDAGVISLEQPQDGFLLPENTARLEFKWRWSLSCACELPPAGYGFELRIWPDRPDFSPLGAMGDARLSQADVFCDSAGGLFGYLVTDLKKTPAVQEAGAGRFRWDVILVQLAPYQVVMASGSRTFELPGESKLK